MDDVGVPSQAPTPQQMQGGDQSQAPSYSLNTNIGLNDPLGKDERMMMDTRNGITTAVPLTMSDQEANFHIENQDKMGAVPPKSPEYNRIIKAIQTGGASEQVFQPWKQVTSDFLKNGLQGLSMDVYKPSDSEEQFYQNFQKGTSQFDQTIGQLGAFVGVGKAVGAVGALASLGLGAMGVGVLPDAFTGLVSKFGMTGAETITKGLGAASNMEATGTIVQATSKIQSELKEGESPDYAKDIGEAASDSAKWALVMGAGAVIAKPFEGMSKIDASGELFKRVSFTGGTTYALMRADNSSHEDSLLGATLMAGLSMVHGGGELMDAEANGKIGQEAINAYARYIKQSNFAIPDDNAYEIGKQVVGDTGKVVIEQSKPISEEERQAEQMASEGGQVQRPQAEIDQEQNEELEKQKADMESERSPLAQIYKSSALTKKLMDKLTVQVVLGDEGEQTLNRNEETQGKEGVENAESGGGSTEEGSGEKAPEGKTETGVHIRDNEEGGLEAKTGEQAGNQEPVKSEGELKKSRLFERVKQDIDEKLKDNPLYNEMNMKEHAEKAIALQKSDPDLVKRVAQGIEPAPDGYSEIALRSAHYQAMRDAGKEEEANQAVTSDTLRGTRLGQEVNMFKTYGKGVNEKHSTVEFIKKGIQDRVKRIGKAIKGKGTPSEKFFKEVDKQKARVKDVINKSKLSDDDINKVIDSIKCT